MHKLFNSITCNHSKLVISIYMLPQCLSSLHLFFTVRTLMLDLKMYFHVPSYVLLTLVVSVAQITVPCS